MYKELIKKAYEVREKAYAPYSKFKVGAALLTTDDRVFTGCNVECASFGGTNCAERTALFKAISEGYREFKAIAIVGKEGVLTPPCGICRQVLNEFASDIDVVLDDNHKEKIIKLSELLPYSFGPKDL